MQTLGGSLQEHGKSANCLFDATNITFSGEVSTDLMNASSMFSISFLEVPINFIVSSFGHLLLLRSFPC